MGDYIGEFLGGTTGDIRSLDYSSKSNHGKET